MQRMTFSVLIIVGLLLLTTVYGSEYHDSDESDCLGCHDDLLEGKFGHFIASNGDCIFCHETGTSPSGNFMATTAPHIICVVCHAAQDSIIENGVHIGIDCTECHNPHSSQQEYLFAKPATELCGLECHAEGDLGLSHPVGEEIKDVRSGGGLSCISSCHSLHDAQSPKLLQMAGLDLCAECHDEKF